MKKLEFKILNKRHRQAGMTYVELIVVLSIFAIMTSITLFNYKTFQAKVDIKNLANNIALKIVEAQKAALSGKLPTQSYGAGWKPAYGVYFGSTNKSFVYFVDLDQSGDYTDVSFCTSPGGSGECLEKIDITKGNYISSATVFYLDGSSSVVSTNLSLTFTRPNSGAKIRVNGFTQLNVSYVQINISSPALVTSNIKVFPSGRIQIN